MILTTYLFSSRTPSCESTRIILTHIILAGALNTLSDNELVIRTGMALIVNQPARGTACSIAPTCLIQYSDVRVVKSAVISDHLAVVVYIDAIKTIVGKTKYVSKYGKHTSAQRAHFLTGVSAPIHVVDTSVTGNIQEEYDRL